MQLSNDMSATMLQVTLSRYVCGVCWGHLTEVTIKGSRYVSCAKDHEHEGFVTRKYAERERLQSKHDKYEVVAMLKEVGVIDQPKTGLTADEIIEEITV